VRAEYSLLKRIYGLDLLRAYSILVVMLMHSGENVLPKVVYNKVQLFFFIDPLLVFFALSGFLIGNILIDASIQNDGFDFKRLKNFLTQRFFRILPTYYILLIIIIILQCLMHPYFSIRDAWTYFVFVQNFRSNDIYFFPESWSLSVEMWFYISISIGFFLIIQIKKIKPTYVLSFIALMVIAAVTILRYYKFEHHPPMSKLVWGRDYRMIVTTAIDGPMYGIIAACLQHQLLNKWVLFKNKFAFGAIIIFSVFGLIIYNTEAVRYSTLFFTLLINIAHGSVLILIFPLFTQLKFKEKIFPKIVTYISQRSYSLYLIHNSIVLYFVINYQLKNLSAQLISQYGMMIQLWLFVLFWILSLMLSELSYRFIEMPYVQYRKRLNAE
jgi:peptidoglycan/LPS O-acetylase OafA/YrhL